MIISSKDIDFLEFIGNQESQEIRDPLQFASDIMDLLEKGDVQEGINLPWQKCHEVQRLRQGELSIWAGINGHGKSELLGQVILSTMAQRRAIVASLEMKPTQTLARMINQYAGCFASPQFALEILDKFSGRLFIYDQLDTVEMDKILGMCHYAAQKLDVKDIVIDSLIKCGVGRENYEAQAKFVDRLQWCAKTWGVHIHLICHMRKTDKEETRPGKYDVRGASEIVDLADNLFIVWRNKPKEKEFDKMQAGREHNPEILMQPDTFLDIAKNRHGGKEKLIGLWRLECGQFVDREPKGYQDALMAPF